MIRPLFPTLLYEADIGDAAVLDELGHSIRSLARDDVAGTGWSRDKGYAGYTSYASLNDLPRRDPAFAELAKLLTRHAGKFADECGFDSKRKPRSKLRPAAQIVADEKFVALRRARGELVGRG